MSISTPFTDYKALFESIPGHYLVVLPDEHFTIVAMTNSYCELTGVALRSAAGKSFFEVFTENVSAVRNSFQSVLQNRRSDELFAREYGHGGRIPEERQWKLMNYPYPPGEEQIKYIIHCVISPAEKHETDNETAKTLESANKELEDQRLYFEKNEKRINRIINALLKYTLMDFSEKLTVSGEGDELDAISTGVNTLCEEIESHVEMVEEANKQLFAVNKELEAFTYSVSHDLRSPLRAIDGFANILRGDYGHLLDEEGKRLLDVVQQNAKKMGTLIDDLLAFSRLGRKDMQKTIVNMKELCQTVITELSKNIAHHAKISLDDLHAAHADFSLIGQVFVNLLSNAIKYSSKTADPQIEITSVQNEKEIIYSVKDNGAGFDMKYVHKLFGVFQRLHRQEEFDGTGVGLAIVHRIVEKHGGKVWAESTLGKGAAFHFSLPLR